MVQEKIMKMCSSHVYLAVGSDRGGKLQRYVAVVDFQRAAQIEADRQHVGGSRFNTSLGDLRRGSYLRTMRRISSSIWRGEPAARPPAILVKSGTPNAGSSGTLPWRVLSSRRRWSITERMRISTWVWLVRSSPSPQRDILFPSRRRSSRFFSAPTRNPRFDAVQIEGPGNFFVSEGDIFHVSHLPVVGVEAVRRPGRMLVRIALDSFTV